MTDLTTQYLGLQLKNPIIVGSCGLTSTVDDIKSLEKHGAAAVVLKSIFEEDILFEADQKLKDAKQNKLIYSNGSETIDYIDIETREERLNNYLNLIKDLKKEVLIPVIASINCISDSEWVSFASRIEKAGADAIELNIFLNPANLEENDFEKTTLNIINKVSNNVSIPISIKLGNFFTNLGQSVVKLSKSDIAGMVLFNRFYSLDIDLEKCEVVSGHILSSPDSYLSALRWVAILSGKVNCSIAASTGIHDARAVIKQILAGADAVQIVSTLYINGNEQIGHILSDMEKWMENKGYLSVKQFKGVLSYERTTNPAEYERLQFMKHHGKII